MVKSRVESPIKYGSERNAAFETREIYSAFVLHVPGDLYIPGEDEVLEGDSTQDDLGAETAFARSEGREIEF